MAKYQLVADSSQSEITYLYAIQYSAYPSNLGSFAQ